MKIVMIVPIVLASALLSGCRSPESTSKNSQVNPELKQNLADSVALPPPGRYLSPSAVKRNGSQISALVDSVIILDEFYYKLFATMRTVEPLNALESLAEPHQSLELHPDYLLSSTGTPLPGNERNAGILRLRSTHPGEIFHALISYSASRGWMISRADSALVIH